MSKVKCYSVRLESLISISEKAYKATAFDGSTAIIPKSQVFGPDNDVQKSDAYWISEWILAQKELQYSNKKESFFDKERADYIPETGIEITREVPEPVQPVPSNEIPELKRENTRQFVITSPCYRANGYHGQYISYAETDSSGNFTLVYGDHYYPPAAPGIYTLSPTNIFECVGLSFSDSDRPISIKEVTFDATPILDKSLTYNQMCELLLSL